MDSLQFQNYHYFFDRDQLLEPALYINQLVLEDANHAAGRKCTHDAISEMDKLANHNGHDGVVTYFKANYIHTFLQSWNCCIQNQNSWDPVCIHTCTFDDILHKCQVYHKK